MEKLIIEGIEVEVQRNYHDNGTINNEWTQTPYDLHGYSKEYYEDGKIKTHREFRNGKEYLVSSRWFPGGQKASEITREEDNYYRLDYFENGGIKLKAKVSPELKFNGEYISYFENGNKQCIMTYDQSGKTVGDFFDFFDTGAPDTVGRYENENLILTSKWNSEGYHIIKEGQGVIEIKDANNNLAQREVFEAGVRHGECLYYTNGILERSVNYVKGIQHGKYISFYKNSKPKEILVFKSGELVEEHRSLPKYDKPKIQSELTVFLPRNRDSGNQVIKQQIPLITNSREVLDSVEVGPEVYKDSDNESVLSEVFRLKIDFKGSVSEFVRSSGSIIPTSLLEKAIRNIHFDVTTIDNLDSEVWIKFDFSLTNNES